MLTKTHSIPDQHKPFSRVKVLHILALLHRFASLFFMLLVFIALFSFSLLLLTVCLFLLFLLLLLLLFLFLYLLLLLLLLFLFLLLLLLLLLFLWLLLLLFLLFLLQVRAVKEIKTLQRRVNLLIETGRGRKRNLQRGSGWFFKSLSCGAPSVS